jgi:hypothetical protein
VGQVITADSEERDEDERDRRIRSFGAMGRTGFIASWAVTETAYRAFFRMGHSINLRDINLGAIYIVFKQSGYLF